LLQGSKMKSIILIAITLFLVGCANKQVPLNQQLQKTGVVSAPKEVVLTTTPTYKGAGSVWADAFTQSSGRVLGVSMLSALVETGIAAADISSMSDGERRVYELMVNNNLDLATLIEEGFNDRLQSSALKKSLTDEETAHKFELTITSWGLETNNGFSSKLSTLLSIRLSLIDPKGKSVWRSGGYTSDIGNNIGKKYSIDEFEKRPKLFVKQFNLAVNSALDQIFKDIRTQL
jgi:hypothetical protein